MNITYVVAAAPAYEELARKINEILSYELDVALAVSNG